MDGLNCPFVIVSSPGMEKLVESVRSKLAILGGESSPFPHYEIKYTTFANGEIEAHIPHTIRRQHVFFIHPFSPHEPHADIMKMLVANDAMKRASVGGITMVAPYLPYMRQDRKAKPRVPITARLVADLLECNKKVEHLITMDLHAEAEEGFFSIPVDNLSSRASFADFIREQKLGEDGVKNAVAVAADVGSAKRSHKFAETLGGLPVVIFNKRRPSANESEVLEVIGANVEGKTALIFDDIIDTAGTVCNTADALIEKGAKQVIIAGTHGLLNGKAIERLSIAGHEVLVTDSISENIELSNIHSWLTVVSTSDLLAKAIHEASLIGGSINRLNQ